MYQGNRRYKLTITLVSDSWSEVLSQLSLLQQKITLAMDVKEIETFEATPAITTSVSLEVYGKKVP